MDAYEFSSHILPTIYEILEYLIQSSHTAFKYIFLRICMWITDLCEFLRARVTDTLPYFEDVLLNRKHGVVILVSGICAVLLILLIVRQVRKSVKIPKEVFGLSVFDLAKTAYEKGHTEAVIHLVEKLQYDVNYQIPISGLTLFLCSCISGKRKLIHYLLKKGGDIYAQTKAGDSALYLATFGILNSLHPDIRILDDLIEVGCSVNVQNKAGYTALHRAAAKGNIPVIRFLLEQGASPYTCSKSKIYPIDSAISSGHLDAAELLAIRLNNQHVWDIIDPHTPARIQLGLQSPQRKHLIESTRPHKRTTLAEYKKPTIISTSISKVDTIKGRLRREVQKPEQ